MRAIAWLVGLFVISVVLMFVDKLLQHVARVENSALRIAFTNPAAIR